MKIGIVFGTRRNAATMEIASWMSEHLKSRGHVIVSAKPEDFDQFDCDLYVLGTAVYAFSAKRAGIQAFIRKNIERISAKPIAVFIVCGADPLEPTGATRTQSSDNPLKRGLKKLFLDRDKYMGSVTGLLRNTPVSTAFFKGYQEPEEKAKIDFESQKQRVAEWCDSILAEYSVS